MPEITELLRDLDHGDPQALEALFSSLYRELKQMARRELSGHSTPTLSPTALVNEAWLKLQGASSLSIESRRHFFACAATAMRQIAIDAARASLAKKRGRDLLFVTLTDAGEEQSSEELLELNAAMDELDAVDDRLRKLVELRFFAGLSLNDIADLTGRSERSLHRDWARARAFIHARLSEV
jgi:RNA polymerase sigma factor (TIGR02999 family)